MTKSNSFVAGLFALLLMFIAQPVLAQTNQALFLTPWPQTPILAETIDEPMLILGGHDRRGSGDMDIVFWDSKGRVKLDRDDRDPKFSIGYRVLVMDVDNSVTGLAGGFSDISVVLGVDLGQFKGWDINVIGGIGIANDNHFSGANGLYGIGEVSGTTDFHNGKLTLGLRYDGNRNVLPDLPLPYAMYIETVNDQFTWYVGLPGSGIIWRPDDQWLIETQLIVPFTLGGKVTYFLNERIHLFGEYKAEYDSFWVHNQDNRRVFYRMHRATIGGRYIINDWLDLTAGVGWAFQQKFSSGWDIRDTDVIARPSDNLLITFAIRGTF